MSVKKMIINISKNIGFCFGVNLAVSSVFKIISSGKKCCTLGEVIHNPSVIEKFKNIGGVIVNDVKEVPKDYTLVIRSHGVALSIFEEIKNLGISFLDATCPFVKKIHKIVNKYSKLGFTTLIAGDKNHCEVQGIIGNSLGTCYVFKNLKELESILKEKNSDFYKVFVVAQTTFSVEEWKKCCSLLKIKKPSYKIFDTICRSTYLRQKEADDISKKSDIMIVVGGNNSSNSLKLKDVCEKNCKTYFVEKYDDLKGVKFKGDEVVGLVSGASVPMEDIIKIKKMLDNKIKGEE